MPDKLARCYKYVWSFVFVRLHMIEMKIFFPWLRHNLPSEVIYDTAACLMQLTIPAIRSILKCSPGQEAILEDIYRYRT